MNPLILMALGAVLGFALIRFPVTGLIVSVALLAHSWRKRHDFDGGAPSQDDDTPPGYVDVAVSIEALMQNNGVMALAVALMIFPLAFFWTTSGFDTFMDDLLTMRNLLLALPALLVGIVLHEGIHALGWIIFGGVSPRSISFGVDRKTLSPYAHADVPTPTRMCQWVRRAIASGRCCRDCSRGFCRRWSGLSRWMPG